MNESIREWYVVGGSPCALRFSPEVYDGYRLGAAVATTNAGIKLFPNPTVYFISDAHACRIYHDAWIEAQARGTHIVSLAGRAKNAVSDRGLETVNEWIEVENHGDYCTYYPGRYCHALLSGTHLVQWVANRPTPPLVVHLVGFEGYRSTFGAIVPDSWTGDPGKGGSLDHTMKCGAFLNSVMRQTPDTRWFVYGDTAWEVEDLKNVGRIP